LDLLNIINKELNLIKFINHWSEAQCICALKFLMEVLIQPKVMYGQWVLSFIKCSMEKLLIKQRVLN